MENNITMTRLPDGLTISIYINVNGRITDMGSYKRALKLYVKQKVF